MLVTEARTKKWMEKCIQDFVLQLTCATPTIDGATLMAPHPRSLIASSVPADDSRQWIPELIIRESNCEPGEEGATITIEEIACNGTLKADQP